MDEIIFNSLGRLGFIVAAAALFLGGLYISRLYSDRIKCYKIAGVVVILYGLAAFGGSFLPKEIIFHLHFVGIIFLFLTIALSAMVLYKLINNNIKKSN